MMTRYLKFAIIISPLIALVAALMLLTTTPAVVFAQEPETICITGTNISVNPSSYLGINQTADYGYIVDSANLLGPPDGAYTEIYDWDQIGDGRSTCVYYALPGIVSTVEESDLITITAAYNRALYRDGVYTWPDQSPSITMDTTPGEGFLIRDEWFFTTTVPFTGTVGALVLCEYNYNIGGGWGYETVDAVTVTVKGQYCYSSSIAYPACDTVTDYHFTGIPTDTWIIGYAEILSSTLTMDSDGFAYQDVISGTFENNTTYSAVVSVTNLTADTAYLLVELHTYSETIVITQAGLYTATFNIAGYGPIGESVYGLTNIGEGRIYIDWTCIYEEGAEPGVCFGPNNGTFDDDSEWDWLDYAHHNASTLSANLPLNLVYPWAYITSTSLTPLPSLEEDKYMILEFDAVTMKNDCSGGLLTIKGRQVGLVMSYTNIFTEAISNQRKTYQLDVSSLAATNVQFLFGNDGGDGQYTDDIDIDNVCVLVSDEPPQTTTTDPGGVSMMCNASGWFDCNDIDGILAYLGVDLPAQRAIYAAGVSLWDYEGWVPWIVAAWWVMVATILCFFLVLITSIINLLTYFLNNFLNYINWVLVNWPLFVSWLGGWLTTIRSSIYYAIEWVRLTAINWLVWLGNAIIEFSEVPWYVIGALGVITSFIFGGFWWLANLLIPLLIYLVAGGDNMLRSIINYLIANGWNGLLTILSSLASTILDTLVVLWNYLAPFFMGIFSAVIGPVGILLILFPAIWDFIWSAFMYLWVNIIQPINIPLAFYTGLSDGIKSGAFSSLMACNGSTGNFWCGLFTGLDLLNGVAGASVLYPIIIAAIIIGTISILYKNIVGLWHFFADLITKI